MSGPKIKIEKENIDLVLEVISIAILLFLFIYPAYHYTSLPNEIPSHFGASGEPDDYRGKNIIWFLSGIGIFIYALLTLLSRIPHTFNYSVKITEKNAATQYRIAVRLMQFMKVIILSAIGYISFVSIQIALGTPTNLGSWFLPVFLVSLFGAIFYTLKQTSTNQ